MPTRSDVLTSIKIEEIDWPVGHPSAVDGLSDASEALMTWSSGTKPMGKIYARRPVLGPAAPS
jgi:hypothetical protein